MLGGGGLLDRPTGMQVSSLHTSIIEDLTKDSQRNKRKGSRSSLGGVSFGLKQATKGMGCAAH
jgi:hypothetical protein